MPNIIKSGSLLLAELLKEYASEIVTYERPGKGSVDVPATFGSKLLRTHDQYGGLRVEWTDLDFIIPAVDIVIDGEQIDEPLQGDLIHVTQGTRLDTYEVRPFGFDPPWRWADSYNIQYRIHAKLMKTSPVV